MKTKTLLLAALLASGSIAFADAGHVTKSSAHKGFHEQYYVRAEAGMSMPTKAKLSYPDLKSAAGVTGKAAGNNKAKSSNSYTFGVGGGYIFNEFFRADATLGYREYKYKKVAAFGNGGVSKVKTFSLMANGYLEAHNDTIFTPYLLAGFGIGWLDPKTSDATGISGSAALSGKKTTNFIWNLGLGVRAKVTDSADVDLTYKYVTLGKAKATFTDPAKATHATTLKGVGAHEILAGIMFRF